MSTTTARYSVQHDSDGWHVVTADEDRTVLGTYPNRDIARAARREFEAQEVKISETADGPVLTDGDEDLSDEPLTAAEAVEIEATAAEGDPEPEPTPEPTPEPEAAAKPEPTGESELARKLHEGHRIVLRGVGTVTVTSVSKVKGVQKVLVAYRDESGAEGERELWVNSKYRLVA